MKKIYKYLILFVCVCAMFSCGNKSIFPIEKEISWAMESFTFYQDSLALDYKLDIHENMNGNERYCIEYNILVENVKKEGEKSFHKSFDEIYDKFGEKSIQNILQKKYNITLDNKKDTKMYFVNLFTANVINEVTKQINVETLIVNVDKR